MFKKTVSNFQHKISRYKLVYPYRSFETVSLVNSMLKGVNF